MKLVQLFALLACLWQAQAFTASPKAKTDVPTTTALPMSLATRDYGYTASRYDLDDYYPYSNSYYNNNYNNRHVGSYGYGNRYNGYGSSYGNYGNSYGNSYNRDFRDVSIFVPHV
jgi:hypothetical protein